MTQIKTTTIDQLPESTDIENLSMFGYAARKPAGSRSVRVPFKAIYPKFGISQQVGTATDKAPSEAAVAAAIKQATPLASDNQNGLLSKEQNKFINDLITEYPMIEEQLKRIADAQDNPFNSIEQKYTHTATMICNNEAPTFVSKFLTLKGSGSPIVATEKYSISKNIGGVVDTPFDMFIEANGVVKLGSNSSLGTFSLLAASVPIVAFLVLRSGVANSIGLDKQPLLGIDITECPNISTVYARYTKFATMDLSKSTSLKTIYLLGNVEMASIDFTNNPALDYANLNSMSKLNSVTLPTSTPNLKTLGISGTALTKDKIMAIGNLWESRVDKVAGTITISPAIFNSMTDEEKTVFTSKNINIATL